MNAKAEFIRFHHDIMKQADDILCFEIKYEKALFRREYENCNRKDIKLSVGFSYDDFIKAVDSLDFDYDSGFGGQELFGYIWYKDGSWSDRYEYDGSECWQHNVVRKIPGHLNGGVS